MLHSLLTVNVISRKELNMDMNIKKVTALGISAILAVMQCACSSETEEEDNYAIQSMDTAYYDSTIKCYKNGLLYETDQINFLDYESMAGIPLCNKPNCTHSDSTCIASLCYEESSMQIVYQDYVYWFSAEDAIVESEDGKSTSVALYSYLKRAALDTGEVETVAEIDDIVLNHALEAVVADSVLYVIGAYEWAQNDDGTWYALSNSGKQYLYRIDLASFEVDCLQWINDAPEVAYTEGLYDSVEIDGIYQDKIYMHYQYVEDEQTVFDFLDTDYTPSSAFTDLPWVYVNICYNLETGEITESDLPYAWCIGEDCYVYTENNEFYVMDADGDVSCVENMQMADESGLVNFNMSIVNGKVWRGSDNACFDIASGECYAFTEKYTDCSAIVIDYVDGQYIVEYYDESGTLCFDKVSESDLIQKM